MSHVIYQTPAMILSTSAMKESNKLVVLYTRDFGLVYVAAQSVREQASKMKSHLQTYSLVDVDLVRGRDIWRLTGIHEKYSSLKYVDTLWYPFIEKIALMVKRMCPGEELNEELWSDIEQLFEIIKKEPENIDEPSLEIIFIARLLNNLGYWSGEEIIISSDELYSTHMNEFIQQHKSQMVKKINEGLQRSQL